MRVDKKFIVNLKGKEYVTLQGLLELAHQDKVSEISTWVKHWSTDQERWSTCKATVVTERGRFTGHGDASPKNVASHLSNALDRMAETRAVCRALRFATNVAITAYDELGDRGGDMEKAYDPVAEFADANEIKRERFAENAQPYVLRPGEKTFDDSVYLAYVQLMRTKNLVPAKRGGFDALIKLIGADEMMALDSGAAAKRYSELTAKEK